ncbi:MAG: polynucleotide adenylyltransferase PcnB [Pseudomonadota bacterium]
MVFLPNEAPVADAADSAAHVNFQTVPPAGDEAHTPEPNSETVSSPQADGASLTPSSDISEPATQSDDAQAVEAEGMVAPSSPDGQEGSESQELVQQEIAAEQEQPIQESVLAEEPEPEEFAQEESAPEELTQEESVSEEPVQESLENERKPWIPPADYVPSPFAIPRDQHSVSRQKISKNALNVLYRLHESGYRALLVGGGVRDVLLGRSPKDFDIATDATPEQVRKLFRNCRLIGRRFRLAHVLFGREIVEVATFRGHGEEDDAARRADESGRLLRDNVYGTLEDDVQRRDFTVNALYYDIADFSVLDHVGGMQDLRDGILRLLGDPETRYREDPVRMLRAARFAAKLGFKLHEDTERPIAELSSLLAGIPPARLVDECVKLFHTGHGAASLNELVRLDLLRWLLPPLHEALCQTEDDGAAWAFLYAALSNTDRRVEEGLPLSTAFLFAALLWPVVVMHAQAHAHAGQPEAMLLQQAGDEVMQLIQPHVAIPRHLQLLIREIWEMQVRFVVHQGRGVASLHGHPRFRAAYDFLLLRAQVGEPQAVEDAAWWQAYVESGTDDAPGVGGGDKGRSKRRRSSRKRKGGESAPVEALDAEISAADDEAFESGEFEPLDAELDEPELAVDESLEQDEAHGQPEPELSEPVSEATAQETLAEAVDLPMVAEAEPIQTMVEEVVVAEQVEAAPLPEAGVEERPHDEPPAAEVACPPTVD